MTEAFQNPPMDMFELLCEVRRGFTAMSDLTDRMVPSTGHLQVLREKLLTQLCRIAKNEKNLETEEAFRRVFQNSASEIASWHKTMILDVVRQAAHALGQGVAQGQR